MYASTQRFKTSADVQGMGEKLLSAMESKLVVAKDMRAFLLSIPPGIASLPASKREEIVSRVNSYVWLFGNRKALLILQDLDHVSQRTFSFSPRNVLIRVDGEAAVVHVRHEGTQLAVRMGFSAVARTQLLTAASELTRNIYMYAGTGQLQMTVRTDPRCGVEVLATDNGPGIMNLDQIMSGAYRSKSGLGLGLRGVKEIAREFSIESSAAKGTTIRAFFSS